MNMSADSSLSQLKPIELVIHNIHDHGVEILDMWMKEVESRTAGRVRFRTTGGEDPSAIKAADLVRDVPATGDKYPLLNLIQIPFIFPSSTIGSRVIAQLYAEFPELRNELSDFKIVGLGIGALLAIFSSKTWGPISTVEDFKGARTRSLPMIDDVVKALGGQPLHVGWFEMSHLLETGGLDALVLGVVPAHVFKLADGAAPYCTLAGKNSITMHPMRLYMKWDSWNRLPPNVQKTIDELGPSGADCWYAAKTGTDSDKHLSEALDYFQQKGKLIHITSEELQRWQRILTPVMDKAVESVEAKGLPARRFYNRMIELVAEQEKFIQA